MKFNHGTRILDWLNIEEVERKYTSDDAHPVKYVGEFCLRAKNGGWSEYPAAVFYQPNPDTSRGHTNYFGILSQMGSVYITNAISATEPFDAIQYRDEIIYSRYRHDFRGSSDGRVFVDGGRDYLRFGGEGMDEAKRVRLQIVGAELMVLPEKPEVKIVAQIRENYDINLGAVRATVTGTYAVGNEIHFVKAGEIIPGVELMQNRE